jgi:hypothetical protein
MRQIRNWYPLLEGTGLNARDMGPGNKPGTLTANVTWCPYYYPPGIPYDYKGVIIGASESRIVSGAAASFNATEGSIEMLVKPSWNNADGVAHVFWDTYGGNNKRFCLFKQSDNFTWLWMNASLYGPFSSSWVANTLYHIVFNWGANQLYINKVLSHTFNPNTLGLGATDLYIGDRYTLANYGFSGNIYYFIVRDVPLTLAEITTFYDFFVNQYI